MKRDVNISLGFRYQMPKIDSLNIWVVHRGKEGNLVSNAFPLYLGGRGPGNELRGGQKCDFQDGGT